MEQFVYSPCVSKGTHEEGTSRCSLMEEFVQDGIQEGTIHAIDTNLLFCIMGSSLGAIIELATKKPDPNRRQKIIDDGLDLIVRGLTA
jgi:hypothetical protein